MPGQFVSVPFLSQVEDMDKYLMEYRSLKLMPQNAAGLQQQQQQQQQHTRFSNLNRNTGIVGNHQSANMGFNGANTRKKPMSANNTAGQNYRFGKNGYKVGPQQQTQQQQTQQQHLQQLQQQQPQSLQGTGLKQTFPQMFYRSANNSASSLAQQALSSQVYAPNNANQQQLMTASSSSSSTPPPRLHVSVSGTSSISSLGGDYDFVLPAELNNQLVPSGSAQLSSGLNGAATSSSNNVANANNAQTQGSRTSMNMMPVAPLGGTFLDSVPSVLPPGFREESDLSGSNDFINGLPSSLLSDGTNAPEFSGMNGQNSVFNARGADSSRNFMMPDSKNWGTGNPNSSSASGSFGIWNNDMSVWS
ncbi:uncharacterized protein LALA0_S01e06414g [Lachancea lanzarotensis]|uniref:LALA0S01e06414g1_1 n=1 Tax=Lachancea lanzarotensis TaxID=1245769 RepID=A0A0C7MXP9_9SACH|nr:uncharacterized protein LALA0_S01e06414g [Lachancea lanzarotensis]CEP60250.1 LALA0S01e06414g1_1 [Lachancea lanzarotensis]